jgi:FKBP-type peptidyl-prolyl cis-trans isomerase SlyD
MYSSIDENLYRLTNVGVNSMPVSEGDFIKISYTGRVGETVFDTTDEEVAKERGIHNPRAEYGPITIRVGSNHVILGLEEAVQGREVGEEGDIEVPAEKAFGPRDESLVSSVSVSQFKEKPHVGSRVEIDNREGVVARIIGRRALVDFNHPFAGKTLFYSFKIEEKVEDIQEQISGLIRLYSGRNDVEVTINDGTVEMLLPPGITYDRRWMLWRGRIIHETFQYIKDVNEIILKETFKRPAEAGEAEKAE